MEEEEKVIEESVVKMDGYTEQNYEDIFKNIFNTVPEVSEIQSEEKVEDKEDVEVVVAGSEENLEPEKEEIVVDKKEPTEEAAKPSLPKNTKLYKAAFGEEEIAVPADAVFEFVSKSGKKERATLEELKSDIYGKREISRRMTELDKREKEAQHILDFHRTIGKKAADLKGYDKVHLVLNELSKVDPALKQDMVDFASKLYEEGATVSRMTPQEQKAYLNEKRLRLIETEQAKEQQYHQESIKEYWFTEQEKLLTKYNLNNNSWENLQKTLLESGQVDANTPLPEFFKIADTYVDTALQRFEKVADTLNKIDPELKNNSTAVNQLYAFLESNPDISSKGLTQEARRLFARDPIQKANEKIKQEQKVSGHSRFKSSGPKKSANDKKVFEDPSDAILNIFKPEI